MNIRIMNAAAYGGPAAVVITLAGWLIAGMLPLPMGPSSSTDEVVAFFTDEPNRVMAGFVLSSLGVVVMIPMLALISVHMLRLEGRTPVLAFSQLAAGATTVLINMFPQMIFAIAAFRVGRDPGDIVLLNDLAWLLLFTGIMPFIVQNVAIGVAILRNPGSVFPRWVGYVNLWVALAFVPDVLAYFFKTGPLAWNGILVFWLALTAYCIFLFVMCFACRKANATLVDARHADDRVAVA